MIVFLMKTKRKFNEATVMDVLARLKEKITIVFVTHRESVVRWFDEVIKI